MFKLKEHSLIFAPMEGVTYPAYRKVIERISPEWDYLCSDFLRVPSQGPYPINHIKKHFGPDLMEDQKVKNKTMFQMLTSHISRYEEMAEQLNELEFPWVDLNLGCPANTVNKNGGGSFLIKDLTTLPKILNGIRKNYHGFLTAKVRIGYHNTKNFVPMLKMIEDAGYNAITVHARTKDQMYKVPATWSYIKTAVESVKIPVVGNGDIWSLSDIDAMFEQTGCHSVMVARGAMKTPWLAKIYYKQYPAGQQNKKKMIQIYFKELEKEFLAVGTLESSLLKIFKSLSHYLFDDIDNGREETLIKILRSQSCEEFWKVLDK
jgi:tRNA-dihydrouridine synthase B